MLNGGVKEYMQSFKLTQTVIGLDVGSRSVKMVELKDTVSGVQLLNFKLVELPLTSRKENPDYDPVANKVSAIKESLKDFDTKMVKVFSVVAGPRVSVRRVVMPPMPKREMIDAVRWEAKNRATTIPPMTSGAITAMWLQLVTEI